MWHKKILKMQEEIKLIEQEIEYIDFEIDTTDRDTYSGEQYYLDLCRKRQLFENILEMLIEERDGDTN